MRIIHFSCTAPPEIGGIGSVAFEEVKRLRARGVEAELVAPTPSLVLPRSTGPSSVRRGEQTNERSFVRRVKPLWRIGNAGTLKCLGELTRGADVVHLHYPFYGTAEFLLLFKTCKAPIVVTYHMDAALHGWQWKQWLFSAERWLFQNAMFDQAARVLVSSFDYAHRSSLSAWARRHPARVTELPFGVDTDFFSPGAAARPRFSIPDGALTLLFVGGLDRAHAFKGLSFLLTLFKRLDPFLHLIIVGDGDLRASYEEEARALGLAQRVHFVGRVDDETLRAAYRTADLFLFPSENEAEAFGLAALEAQSSGVPVLASDLPGVRTVVRHGETGLLLPVKNLTAWQNAVESLLTDEARRLQMGQQARIRVEEKFSWERHVDELLRVYEEVCRLKK